jgi:hypothetical protein
VQEQTDPTAGDRSEDQSRQVALPEHTVPHDVGATLEQLRAMLSENSERTTTAVTHGLTRLDHLVESVRTGLDRLIETAERRHHDAVTSTGAMLTQFGALLDQIAARFERGIARVGDVQSAQAFRNEELLVELTSEIRRIAQELAVTGGRVVHESETERRFDASLVELLRITLEPRVRSAAQEAFASGDVSWSVAAETDPALGGKYLAIDVSVRGIGRAASRTGRNVFREQLLADLSEEVRRMVVLSVTAHE